MSTETVPQNTTKNAEPYLPITLDLGHKGSPQYLSRKIKDGIERGYRMFQLRLYSEHTACYPNICVPLAGVIDHYRTRYGCSFFESSSWRNATYLEHAGVIQPYELNESDPPASFLDRIWRFTAETHYRIVEEIMESLRRSDPMEEGVLNALELALNEVTDNTLQHYSAQPAAESATGYVMVQYHKNSHHIAVAVFDAGQGIPKSLARVNHPFTTPAEALMLALHKGVTDGNGAGNGLWMMDRVVSATAGSFTLTSDGARYSSRHLTPDDEPKKSSSLVQKLGEGTTLVDFQLRTDRPIDIQRALDGHDPVNIWIDDHLDDDNTDNAHMLVKNESRGCASRYEGKAFANKISNLLSAIPGTCTLDFDGISIVSASFIDELVSDLIRLNGFMGFVSRVRLANVSPASAAVINSCFNNRYFNRSEGTPT